MIYFIILLQGLKSKFNLITSSQYKSYLYLLLKPNALEVDLLQFVFFSSSRPSYISFFIFLYFSYLSLVTQPTSYPVQVIYIIYFIFSINCYIDTDN